MISIKETLDFALFYSRRGWPVLPLHTVRDGRCSCCRWDCQSSAKHPKINGGHRAASTDPKQITDWWRQWPEANLGIATGAAAGFFVLDVDPRNLGDESLAELQRKYGELPETIRSFTGGGGQHLFFKLPTDRPIKSGTPFQGIDIKGGLASGDGGGFVVAPPSIHRSGLRYAWDVHAHPDDLPIAVAPAWLVAAVAAIDDQRHPLKAKSGDEWLEVIERGRRKGTRNDAVARIFGHLVARNVNSALALELVCGWNQANVKPPQDEKDIRKVFSSIVRAQASRLREKERRHG